MAVSFKLAAKTTLLGIWKILRKAVSFLTSLIIVTAMTVTVLFLAHIRPYVVVTGSMEPAIPVQSVCFVNENFPLEKIAVGEVISFQLGENTLVTHRVVSIKDGEYTTRGDANSMEDASPVTAANYIGKTVLVIPKVGFILSYLHTTGGKITAISLIVLLILLTFLPAKKKETETS